MEAFRRSVINEEDTPPKTRAEKMYEMGYNAGLSGEGKSQKQHIRDDQDYTDGYSDGVGVRRGESGRKKKVFNKKD